MVDPAGPYSLGFEGTHPILFPSAGKHHIYVFPARNKFDVSFAGHCWDPHRGDGRQITPGVTAGARVIQVPATSREDCYESSDQDLPPDLRCRCVGLPSWVNSCAWARGELVEIDPSFQRDDLSNLGYPTTLLNPEFLSRLHCVLRVRR